MIVDLTMAPRSIFGLAPAPPPVGEVCSCTAWTDEVGLSKKERN